MSEPRLQPAEPTPDPDLSGRTLGDYQLLRRLGRGNMAEVYLAEQLSLRRQVAVKTLRRSLAADQSYVRRFHNEAQAAAALIHANIVQIYEVGCVDGVHFIAQEYVPGQNLRQLLARRGSVDLRTAVSIMRQVGAALAKSARHGIVHRDIKPENILLAPGGEVKVADFGLARFTREGEAVDLTQAGVTMGTPLYMSPEQVEGRPLDPRSDIYSFGVTCYQMLAGRPPFEGDTPLSVAVQHLRKAPQRLEERRPDLPPGLCRIVHKMLAKDPAQRHQNAAELLRELRALALPELEDVWGEEADQWATPELLALSDARLAATQQLDSLMKAEGARRQPLPRRRWIWAACAVAAALAGGAAIGWLTRPPSLLAARPGETTAVMRQDSAMSQYYFAIIQDDPARREAALKAVLDYFPAADPAQEDGVNEENQKYNRLAILQLGSLYADTGKYLDSLRCYAQLANLDESEADLKAQGLAGQAYVLLVLGRRDQAMDALQACVSLMPRLGADQQRDLERRLMRRFGDVWPELAPALQRMIDRVRQGE